MYFAASALDFQLLRVKFKALRAELLVVGDPPRLGSSNRRLKIGSHRRRIRPSLIAAQPLPSPLLSPVNRLQATGTYVKLREMDMMTTDTMESRRGSRSEAQEHSEGALAKAIEKQTAKLPSDVFLWAAGASIIGSLTLKVIGREHNALFVGQWAAPFLLLGIYNKIVKVNGSDRTE